MWSPFYISLLFWYKTLWERAKWYLLLKFVWWAAMYLLQATCCCGMMRFSAQCSQLQWWSTMIHNRNVGTQKRFNCNKRVKWSPVYQTILISRICFISYDVILIVSITWHKVDAWIYLKAFLFSNHLRMYLSSALGCTESWHDDLKKTSSKCFWYEWGHT